MTTYRASDYTNHRQALAMVRQDGGQATPEAAALYVAMAHAERHGDLGNTYRVDPNAGTVERVQSSTGNLITEGQVILPYHDVYTEADVREGIKEAMGTGEMPEYHYVFDRAENMEPTHYRYHMQDFVEGDEHNEPRTFVFQSVPIECEYAEDDEFYGMDRDVYGWALVASAVHA